MISKYLKSISKLPINKFHFSGYVSHRQNDLNNDSTPFDFTLNNYKQVQKILAKYPSNWKRSAIIPLLHLAQKQNNNFLPLSAMRKVAKIVEVNQMDVYQVASFYTMFNREKIGKFHLQICGTTPCMLKGSQQIIEACEKHLGIKSGQTTPDYLFTIQEVECLGACANAPMIQVNGVGLLRSNSLKYGPIALESQKWDRQKRSTDGQERLLRTSRSNNVKNLQHEIKYERDFKAAKEEWEENQRKRIEAEKKKAEEAKKIEQQRRKKQAKQL